MGFYLITYILAVYNFYILYLIHTFLHFCIYLYYEKRYLVEGYMIVKTAGIVKIHSYVNDLIYNSPNVVNLGLKPPPRKWTLFLWGHISKWMQTCLLTSLALRAEVSLNLWYELAPTRLVSPLRPSKGGPHNRLSTNRTPCAGPFHLSLR